MKTWWNSLCVPEEKPSDFPTAMVVGAFVGLVGLVGLAAVGLICAKRLLGECNLLLLIKSLKVLYEPEPHGRGVAVSVQRCVIVLCLCSEVTVLIICLLSHHVDKLFLNSNPTLFLLLLSINCPPVREREIGETLTLCPAYV